MSIERSNGKVFQRSGYDPNQARIKASLTQEGFYRKNNNSNGMNLSNLSQKQSIYDHKYAHHIPQTTSEFGYQTLNPAKQHLSSASPPRQQQHMIIIEFELKRQRQKNRILQQRLKNKVLFIENLNNIERQLTDAFKQCQEELQFYKRKSSQPSAQVREYLEEINELKHLVIRLEDKITEYQKRENKRYSSVKHSSLEDQKKSISKFPLEDSIGRVTKVREKRSKTVMNQPDSSPQFRKFDMIEQYISKNPTKISSFIQQFLVMVEWFSVEAQQAKKGSDANNLKKRLKIGWKWIKQAVGEWNSSKSQIDQYKHFLKKLRRICNIPESIKQFQSLQLILASLRK